ncbi:MAG: hypothetical protein KDD40_09490, partial [Bdellovibrionales bacterium]|nr:hypothetical protein [Bdellovibrionales bacterium]
MPVQRPYQPFYEQPQTLKPPYVSPGEPKWTRTLFTDKLIADFYRKYEEEIGAFESSRLIRSFPDFYDQYTLDNLTFRQELIEQNKRMLNLGEYITLKTFEYHLDQYLKSHPSTKKAYEVKIKYTNADIKLGQNRGDLKFKYSLSGNYLESRYEWEELFLSYKIEFKKLSDGLFQQAEGIWLLDYKFSHLLALRVLYFALENGYNIILRRTHFNKVTISLTYSGNREVPDTLERDNRIMLGAVFYLPP